MAKASPLPRDFESLRRLILEKRASLPRRIAQVAAYALDNPDEIAFGTAASIAACASVQPSTLIRFAQHLGYDGFTSLQGVFRDRLRGRIMSYDERLSALRQEDGTSHNRRLLQGFVAASTQSLETMLQNIDDTTIERVVAGLAKAETIYIVARRRSYPIAGYLAYAFGKLKIGYRLLDSPADLDTEVLSFATGRDAAIVISFSPYTATTVDHAKKLADIGVPIFAITDSAFSPLVQSAEAWFEIVEADFAGFRSSAATMALSTALAVAVAEARLAVGGSG